METLKQATHFNSRIFEPVVSTAVLTQDELEVLPFTAENGDCKPFEDEE